MDEKNKPTLKDALKRLSVYQPEDKIWDGLHSALSEAGEKENHRETLVKAIRKLPVYAPGVKIWEGIEKKLNRKVILSAPWMKVAAVISGLLIISAGTFWIMSPRNGSGEALPTIQSEKLIKSPLPSTKAEIAEYENQMVREEEQLRICLDQLSGSESEEIAPAMEKLKELSETRDNLVQLLDTERDLPGARPRLETLEKYRHRLIRELKEQVCR